MLATVSRSPRTRAAPAAGGTIAAAPRACAFPSELGWMALVLHGDALAQLTFGHPSPAAARDALDVALIFGAADAPPALPLVKRLQAYAGGHPDDFADVLLAPGRLGPFAARVVALCRQIPFGRTLTYGELAALAGSPRAARAVGNVMRTNRCPLVVPCHRVVPAAGGMGSYSAADGARTRRLLLAMESGAPA
jgi:methylated-DNA-[protein]-cysteine S-methyltransferase